MAEFIDIFDKAMGKNKLYNEVKNNFARETFDLEVLMTILEDLAKDKKNLWSTISPQTSAFLFRKMRDEGVDYIDLLADANTARTCLSELKGIIRKECFEAVQTNADMILEVYDQLFKRLSQSELAQGRLGGFRQSGDKKFPYPTNLKIFTTNYDTCIETLLNRHQVNFTQGIVPRYGYNVFDVDSFNDKDQKVGVFKLHGSVDLFRKNGEIRQLPVYTPDMGLTYLGEEYGEELMRYPIEFGGYRHVIESPYLDLFRLFRDRMRVGLSQLWLLIGSSFRDRTICSIINDVLRLKERGEQPIVLFVNPSGKAIVERLKKWGMNTFAGLISVVEASFGTSECITKLDEALNPQRTIDRARRQKLSAKRP